MSQLKLVEAQKQLVSAFTKVFYAIPTLPPHTIMVDGKDALVSEPTDCILWLLETLKDESGCCAQTRLERFAAQWYPPKPGPRMSRYNFSRRISSLIKAGFVHQSDDEKDRRLKRLRLTISGDHLLKMIQAERFNSITQVLNVIPRQEWTDILTVLDRVADAAWRGMQQRADGR